ncbi:MAG: drug efflux system protein MdtG [Methanosaeta sp. PtaU1.Bin112]|nr:MAG: drug efflux system protein MdtG [Methanosaeta sp. PtaU1.Bin112]
MPTLNDSSSLAPHYLAIFVAVLGFSLVAPFFPYYVMNLGASYTMLGFIVSVYGAMQLLTQIPIGRLSDRIGRKKIMLIGLATFSFLPLFYIFARNTTELLFIRALGGLGASAVWPIAMALIIDQAKSENRGAAMGHYNAAFFSALALGPLIGGMLYDHLGHNAPFYLWAILGAASLLVVYFRVDEPEKMSVIMGTVPSRGDDRLIEPGYALTFMACSSVVLWAGIVGGFNFTMLPSLAAGLGFNATYVGIIYLVYGGSTALFNIYFGRQADRGSKKRLIFAGCLLGALCFAALPLAKAIIAVTMLFAGLGMGLGMANPAAAALIADTTSASRRGEVYGIFNTARMSGVVIGPLIAGLTADLHGVEGSVRAFAILAIAITLLTLFVRESIEERCR